MSEEKQTVEQVEAPIAEEENVQLQTEVNSLKDQLLRKSAEFENYKKVQSRNQQKAIERKLNEMMTPILDVFSDLLLISRYTDSGTSLKEAIEIVQKKINKNLNKLGFSPVGEVGEEFDPVKHEAITQVQVKEAKSNTVYDVVEYGWMIDNKCIIPAKVIVNI